MKLSEHFSLSEFERSATATKHGIDNRVPSQYIPALQQLCKEILEPLRSFAGEPIKCTFGADFTNDIDTFTSRIWNALNADNKVSLFTRFIDLATGKVESRIVNKNQ